MRDLSRCVVHPEVPHEGFASLAVPTYRASTIVFDGPDAYTARSRRGPDGYTYGLHGTPTSRTLEAQLSELEQGVRTVLLPSGQAAIAVVMLATLLSGDRVLIPDTAYPPVRGFCANYLGPRGIAHEVYDPQIGAGIAGLIDDRTKLVWVESPGSTTMEVQDIPAIAAAAHARGTLVGCDNTWATPLLFKPLRHGVDFSMQALTKYVGGHGDLLMGSVSVADIALQRRLKDIMRMLGLGVSPEDCGLALRGLETMGVRMAHAGRVALDMAKRIACLPGVERVLHPALPDCPGHTVWQRDFAGASGVFSVVLKSLPADLVAASLRDLRTFAIGASWGGTRSLIVPMAIAADRSVTPWPDPTPLLRISIGMEDPADLWDDLATVFARIAQRGLAG